MINFATSTKPEETLVGMGQIAAGGAERRMRTVVGSCIAVVLFHPKIKMGAMAHVVLPDSAGRAGAPGKFADTAVPAMLALLQQQNTPPQGLTARFAGGANMFSATGPLQIGEANVKAVVGALRIAGIPVIGQDVGGTRGRRVSFDCASGAMTVECAGQPPRIL